MEVEQSIYYFGEEGEIASLSNFVWIDPQPHDDELESLLAAAADFIEEISRHSLEGQF